MFSISQKRWNLFVPLLYVVASVNVICHSFLKYFSFLDEIVVALLLLCGINLSLKKTWRSFYAVMFCMIVYLLYSLFWGQNVTKAVLLDFLLFLKPIICFFIPYLHPFELTEKQRSALKTIYLLLGIFCILQVPFLDKIYSNTAAYYRCCIVSAVSFLYFSKMKKKDILFAFMILAAGLLSIRAKYFTEFIFFIFVLFYLKSKIRINLKWFVLITVIAILSIYVNWQRFALYFIDGIDNGMARSLFYYFSPNVLIDYAPFGSGFGTYNTEGAAQFYSPLYHKYGFDSIWGTRMIDYRTDHDFLHDTFYPALTQFGFLGIACYFLFWTRIWQKAKHLSLNCYKLFLLLFFTEFVENLADNAFTSSNGIAYIMMIGILLSSVRNINTKGRIYE